MEKQVTVVLTFVELKKVLFVQIKFLQYVRQFVGMVLFRKRKNVMMQIKMNKTTVLRIVHSLDLQK